MPTNQDYLYRHIGPRESDIQSMLGFLGLKTLDDLIGKTVPQNIRLNKKLDISEPLNENEFLRRVREISFKNQLFKSYIGMGFYDTVIPSVIKRNILENPSWYTSYTPYQAEISQGRLEALFNFQTMVVELTGMELANASLLDESSAAAEAMIMMFNARPREAVKNQVNKFFIDKNLYPQTISVIKARATYLDIEVVEGGTETMAMDKSFFGSLLQYPNNSGEIFDYKQFTANAHDQGVLVGVATDLMALVLLSPPGHWGADVVVGSSQRFGLSMGYGGPHAGFFATREEHKRLVPGRIIGLSIDKKDRPAYRMALQTREQHIKREKATSNICTAQALLAIMSGMYAVYHGREGLKQIASSIHAKTVLLEEKLRSLGFDNQNQAYFDTLKITLPENINPKDVQIYALEAQMNFRYFEDGQIGISLDETTTIKDINDIVGAFAKTIFHKFEYALEVPAKNKLPGSLLRTDDFLDQGIFNKYRSETEMMRYIKRLEKKDISLTDSMISLGSCTMKLNAASTMFAIGWPEFANIHPFAPVNQTEGYQQLFYELGKDLKEITGFDSITFQPNSGATGEYTGLAIIRDYHQSIGQGQRNIVLIPSSAHGTNPASAAMAGMHIVVVKCDANGNIDLQDLKAKVAEHQNNLSCIMVTYPSTHGVFESSICEITDIIHAAGGQVYMDGANMNAQVGLTNPALIGADVCHLNLHKTFAIPHGGGGPGVGPVCAAKHLTKFLPGHPVVQTGGVEGIGPVAAAPWGSASILTISYAYCKMLGHHGLAQATKVAILNSNYLAKKLEGHYQVLYKGSNGYVAHEMILDCRGFKETAGIAEVDIAKRLIDYGFHAPTVSFPVHGTLMIEPTESESKVELDRFVDAMISIHNEITEIATGVFDKENNVLKNAPHSYLSLTHDAWEYSYTRQKAGFPLPWLRDNKYWPPVDRLNDAYGDRNLVCACSS
jgi:glycine dehydrogenase